MVCDARGVKFDRLLAEKSHKARLTSDKSHLRWLDAHLRDIPLVDITTNRLETIAQAQLDDGASTARANRMLAVIRSILRCATNQWDWLDKPPVVRLFVESKRRIRWLTHEPKSGSWQVLNPSTRPLRGLLRANGLPTHLMRATKNRSC